MRSADAQIAAMHRDWPTFKLCRRSGGRLMWRGSLTPLATTYTLQVELSLPREIGYRKRLGGIPRVTVHSPKLTRRVTDPDTPIPHVYKNVDDPGFPILCLYDPAQEEWNQDYLVAETIIPWSIEWLACYEFWHVDGNWVGGGRHPGETPEPMPEAI